MKGTKDDLADCIFRPVDANLTGNDFEPKGQVLNVEGYWHKFNKYWENRNSAESQDIRILQGQDT